MAKALKPLIIVLLVFSMISLVLGILLFGKREQLKGRTLKGEQAIAQVADKLHYDKLDKEKLKDFASMDSQISPLVVFADNQYVELQDTKKDLDETRAELTSTKEELAATQTELTTAQAKVTELTAAYEQKEAEVAQAKSKAEQLEQEKSAMQMQVDDLNNQLVKAEEELRDAQDQISTLEKIVQKLDTTTVTGVPQGLSGKVMTVNKAWNFVVLDIGSGAGLVPNAEMLVHRDDNLVGKVKVTSVQKNMAVAEILGDWQKKPVEEGDYVLF
jgi:predicted RNase H-like nuclease (RuvC/YqgF family)